MPELNMVEAINQALHQEMERDKRVVCLGEDVGKEGGVFRVTAGLQKKYGEARVMDTPLAEPAIVGTSIGMAAYGLRPVAEIQFSGFIYPAFDQLASHAGRIRNRSRGKYSAPLVVRVPCSGGVKALDHHAESYEALFAHTPGLKVVMPSRPYDAKGLLISAIRDPDPVIFMEPKRVYRALKEEVPEEIYTIPLGKANIIKEGTDFTIVSWGAMVKTVLETLSNLNYNAEVIDLRTISPWDKEAVINSVKKTGRLVIVSEAVRTGNFASEIIAEVNDKALLNLDAPVERVTGFDIPFPLFKSEFKVLPSEERIKAAIEKVMDY